MPAKKVTAKQSTAKKAPSRKVASKKATPQKVPVAAQPEAPTGFYVRIVLAEVKPIIWRELWIPAACTLHEVHELIQISMGWQNSHLYQFLSVEHPDDGSRGTEELFSPPSPVDSESGKSSYFYTLGHFLSTYGYKAYEYDLGDSWCHEFYPGRGKAPKEEDFPVLLAGERACPPENCGGPPGYEDILKTLRKGTKAEVLELKRDLPKNFDPAEVDLEKKTAAVAAWAKRWLARNRK